MFFRETKSPTTKIKLKLKIRSKSYYFCHALWADASCIEYFQLQRTSTKHICDTRTSVKAQNLYCRGLLFSEIGTCNSTTCAGQKIGSVIRADCVSEIYRWACSISQHYSKSCSRTSRLKSLLYIWQWNCPRISVWQNQMPHWSPVKLYLHHKQDSSP